MRLEVQTVNTLYTIMDVPGFDNVFMIKGSATFCPEWTLARVVGPAKVGECFQFDLLSGPYASDGRITTSVVRSIGISFPVKEYGRGTRKNS